MLRSELPADMPDDLKDIMLRIFADPDQPDADLTSPEPITVYLSPDTYASINRLNDSFQQKRPPSATASKLFNYALHDVVTAAVHDTLTAREHLAKSTPEPGFAVRPADGLSDILDDEDVDAARLELQQAAEPAEPTSWEVVVELRDESKPPAPKIFRKQSKAYKMAERISRSGIVIYDADNVAEFYPAASVSRVIVTPSFQSTF